MGIIICKNQGGTENIPDLRFGRGKIYLETVLREGEVFEGAD